MVSKGWRRDLAHSDASADARLFFRPSMASEDLLDLEDEDESPPPREIIAAAGTADGRRRRRLILLLVDDTTSLSASTSVACGAATGRMYQSGAEAETLLLLLSRHATRQSRIACCVGLIMGNEAVYDATSLLTTRRGTCSTPRNNGTKMNHDER